MSPRTPIVTLNLGSQSLEVAVFYTEPSGRLFLCGYRSRDLPADPAQDGTRKALIVAALVEMLDELRIKGGRVNYSVAEELIFTRFVEVPVVETEKLERIISFEAQQNVPFPISEVIWDYQQIGSVTKAQVQVILAAIKADLIEEINAAVEATGLRTSVVDLATMALYNAFRHSYSELVGCSLLVDIGAHTTNLLFIEPGRVFTRSVQIGGSSVTSAIAKEFGEPFAAAELRKKRTILASGGNGRDPADGDGSRVSKILRGILTRLHAELQRSISHYCAQQYGQPPERIFLSGGGASTSAIQEFFCEKLQLPTEFFNPLRNLTVSESGGTEGILRSAHLLGEPVGLALRAFSNCPVQLDLSPKSVVLRKEREKRQPVLIAALVCLILSLLGWRIYYAWTAAAIRQNLSVIEAQVARLQRIESQLDTVRTRIATLDKSAAPFCDAINDRGFWPHLLEELNAQLPAENLWITDLAATSAGTRLDASDLHVRRSDSRAAAGMTSTDPGSLPSKSGIDGILVSGLYLFNPKQQEVVMDYFRNLCGSSLFAIDPIRQAKVIKPTTPTNTEWAFPYELHLELRKPVALP